MINSNLKAGDKVYLSALSAYGKKTLQENGAVWRVLEIKDRVLACKNKPGFLVESVITHCWLWVAIEKDMNFIFHRMKENGKNK